MSVVVALLRAVNVGGRQLRSADLRAAATGIGLTDVVTYLASGNLVATAERDDVAAALTAALLATTGLQVPVLTRDLPAWERAVAQLPMPDEAAADPAHLALVCFDGPVGQPTVPAAAVDRERVVWADDVAYVWYPDGQGRSRLTLDVLQRAAGRVGTARNWRTVLALRALAHDRAVPPVA